MRFLKKMDLLQVEGAGKRNFDAAAKGHYLDRILELGKIFKIPKDHMDLLHAFKNFHAANHAPSGLNEFLDEVGGLIAHIAVLDKSLTPADWAKIVWGLPDNVVKQYKLDQYKKPTK